MTHSELFLYFGTQTLTTDVIEERPLKCVLLRLLLTRTIWRYQMGNHKP